MTTKTQVALIAKGPFAGRMDDLRYFFGTQKATDRFLVDFTEARTKAVKDEKNGTRSTDCTFPEQFWDGRLFLDSDDMHDIGLDRESLDTLDIHVFAEDQDMEADIHLIRYGRRRLIVVDWTWKEDGYALDAWWLE